MSAASRRIEHLESTNLQNPRSSSVSVTQHAFRKQVRPRMRLKREGFEKAAPALVDLRDDQLEALLDEAEASAANIPVPCGAESQTLD